MTSKIIFFTLLLSVMVLCRGGVSAPCGTCGGCCSELSPENQKFASQLNSVHQRLFCAKFSDAQRLEAMQMVVQKNPSGEITTPDQAVQKVALDNQLLPRSGGACPHK